MSSHHGTGNCKEVDDGDGVVYDEWGATGRIVNTDVLGDGSRHRYVGVARSGEWGVAWAANSRR